jgi:hypothetical protein
LRGRLAQSSQAIIVVSGDSWQILRNQIADDEMYFNVISRVGQTVDAGVLTRRKITH